MQQNKPTINEHYIPQCYLKQFSPDGENIYQYDVLSGEQKPSPVPTRSICYEKNLYEFKDSAGEIVYRNLIEKGLSIFEGEFANTFRSIQSKARHKENFNTSCFLTTKEKAMLIFFMATLTLRNPDVLNIAQETADEILKIHLDASEINKSMTRNIALQYCLPIYKELDVKERNILNAVMGLFEDMSFGIGVTDKECIFTSDNPVVVFGENSPVVFKLVILPLSPCLVLFMTPLKDIPRGCYNRLLALNSKFVQFVNLAVADRCKRWIYSKSLLTKKQIKLINEGSVEKYELF